MVEEVVRSSQAPPVSPGHRVSPVTGINGDVPQTEFGSQGAGTPTDTLANTDRVVDWSRWAHLRTLLVAGQEVASAWRDVSGSLELDLNACTIWRLRVQGSTLSISFKDLEALPKASEGSIWEEAVRSAVVEVMLQWQSAAESRTVIFDGVKFPSGVFPLWSPTATIDVVMVQIFSDGLKIARAVDLDFSDVTG